MSPARTATIALAALLAAGCTDGTAPVYSNGDPAAAEIVTSDLERFWQAADGAGLTLGQYLADGTPGLKEFARKSGLTEANLRQALLARPRYFAGIRASMLDFARGTAMRGRLRTDFTHLKELYPAAVFPPVTFVVGRFSRGGTIGEAGLLIGAEFYTGTAATPRDELGHFEKANVRQIDTLPFIVMHELTHIQQAQAGSRASQGTLLDQALMEGSADFVAELVAGGHVNGRIHDWALPREAQLWADFRTAMDGRDVSRWLYNQGTETLDRPGDLGYFIGYRIARAYYARATDKRAALRAILRVKDAKGLLEESGYDPR